MKSAEAIKLVLDLQDKGWIVVTDDWIAQQLSQALWDKIQKRNRRSSLCAQLDDLASKIENLPATVTAEFVRALGVDPLVAELVTVLVSRPTTPRSRTLAAVAKHLRLIGVYLCAITDRLNSCPCLRSLAEPITTHALATVLTAATSP